MQPKKKQLHLCTCKPYNESSVRVCRWYVHLPSVEYIQMSFTIILFYVFERIKNSINYCKGYALEA